MRGTQTPTSSHQSGIVFGSDLARKLSALGDQWMMLQENNAQPVTSPVNLLPPITPCRMVLNNSVKSNMTCSHKPVLLSVCRLYFSASFEDCASGSTLRWTTKMPDKGTIQRFNVNSSHLPLQLLNLKAGGKRKSVKPAAAMVLIFYYS